MTKIDRTPHFDKLFNCYGDKSPIQAIQYRDSNHTPDNKRQGQVNSQLTVTAKRHEAGEYVELSFEEITTTGGQYNGDKPARTAGRTISNSFKIAEALKLARFIVETAAMNGVEGMADALHYFPGGYSGKREP